MQRTRKTATAVALTAAAALLAGCGGTGQDEGAPGGPAQQEQEHGQHQPQQQGDEPEQDQPGETDRAEADVEFVRGMIPHHQQAVSMSEMARGRTDDPQVREMADQILAAQGPEIEKMSGWLTEWGVPLPNGGEHGPAPEQREPGEAGHAAPGGHGGREDHADQEPGDHESGDEHGDQEHGGGHEMHGMLAPDQMGELRQSHGAEFDRLYLSLMIEHHEGAVQMARQELAEGRFAPAQQLAQQMIDTQRAEIDEMRQLQQP